MKSSTSVKALMFSVFLVFPFSCFAQEAGVIASISGASQVQVIRKSNDNHPESVDAKTEDKVYYGDKIVTTDEQSVLIKTDKGTNQISIGPSTSFEIDRKNIKGRQTPLLSLFRGMLRALYKKSYSGKEVLVVKTPSAVMGVRGTDFVVQVNENSHETQLHTISGTVALATSLSALVQTSGASGLVSMVSKGQMGSLSPGMQKAEVKDFNINSFKQSIQKKTTGFEQSTQNKTSNSKSMSGTLNQTTGSKKNQRNSYKRNALNQSSNSLSEKTDSSSSQTSQKVKRRNLRGGMSGQTLPGMPGMQGTTTGSQMPNTLGIQNPTSRNFQQLPKTNLPPPPPPPPSGSGGSTLPPPPPPPQ